MNLGKGTAPSIREQLIALPAPWTFVYPAGDMPANADRLSAAGVRVGAVPNSGHNIMLDSP
jgi:hypothetical protein